MLRQIRSRSGYYGRQKKCSGMQDMQMIPYTEA